MAIRIRGKSGYYHSYYRRADGTLTEVNLLTRDVKTARALDEEIRRKNRAMQAKARLNRHLAELSESAGEGRSLPEGVFPLEPTRRRKRLKLIDAEETAKKYRPLSGSAAKIWRSFIKSVPYRYFDEITAEGAFEYLKSRYNESSGKTYNNNLSSLNSVFSTLLLEAGLKESPFGRIPRRSDTPQHQRAFTDEEVGAIIEAADWPWNGACTIAYYTGLRQKDCFSLKWANIKGDVIEMIPSKTSRYNRGVRIRLHPELSKYLSELPRGGENILGEYRTKSHGSHQRYFGELLKSLGIINEQEIVNFNSFRNTFISNCVKAGIALELISGTVGHTEGQQTQLYNTEAISSTEIAKIPKISKK